MADDNIDPTVKQFADLYGLKILFGQVCRPYWIQDDGLWATILASLDARVKMRKADEELVEAFRQLKEKHDGSKP